ncbi:MAG: phosphatidylglycerophosphatase A [Candidatus Latescibacteria bacterium]|nr:phosphatidylglycerophosphatase A [bacterium]MBD3423839.1 phosphatidylglycerophosphatase A [Candidatus Latescibacterota bacterium]
MYSVQLILRRISLTRRIVTLLGSFFYSGFFPIAPASFASFIWVIWYLYIPGGRVLVNPYSLLITIPLSVLVADRMESYYGHDAPEIVIDEFVGMQISLLMFQPTLKIAAAGFLLFRVYDIAKPFPAGASQRIPGGAGVVIDDIIAGVYSFLTLKVVLYLTGIF